MHQEHVHTEVAAGAMFSVIGYITAVLALPVIQLIHEAPTLAGSTYQVLAHIDSDGDGLSDQYDIEPYKR